MENEKESVKVLIVDDEQDIRTLLNIYLKRLGYDVVEAADGVEAVETVRADKDIDLIVMDIMMPKLSGTEACQQIREFSSIPVLFLTAKTKEPDQNEAYDVGGDDFLAKPFTQSEFNRKVNALIRRYKVYRGKSETDPKNISVGNINIDSFKRIVIKNGEVIKLTDQGVCTSVLPGGAQRKAMVTRGTLREYMAGEVSSFIFQYGHGTHTQTQTEDRGQLSAA